MLAYLAFKAMYGIINNTMNTPKLSSEVQSVSAELITERRAESLPHHITRGDVHEVLQPDALRECYETFEDFKSNMNQVNITLTALLRDYPEEIPAMQKIIDDAVALYTRPYQYHNAIHMLTTLNFAFDRAIRVNELQPNRTDIVERVKNVTTMVAYHDTGNKNAPRPNGIDEMEASDNLLADIANAEEGDPLYVYTTPEGIQDRNIIVAALLGSLFRERFVSSEAMRAEMAKPDSVRYNYVKETAVKLGISADELAGLIADNKYSKLMRNADIASSLWTQRLKNLFLNYWEDLQRENSTFPGQTSVEYDVGFKKFITGQFAGQTDDKKAVDMANSGRPMLIVPGIKTDSKRDSVTLMEAGEYLDGIFQRHEPFIDLVFAQFSKATNGGDKFLISRPLSEVMNGLKQMQAQPSELDRLFLKKKDRTPEAAQKVSTAITSIDLNNYEQRMNAAGLNEKCWAQLTERDICVILGEQVPEPYEFAVAA